MAQEIGQYDVGNALGVTQWAAQRLGYKRETLRPVVIQREGVLEHNERISGVYYPRDHVIIIRLDFPHWKTGTSLYNTLIHEAAHAALRLHGGDRVAHNEQWANLWCMGVRKLVGEDEFIDAVVRTYSQYGVMPRRGVMG